MPEYDYVNPYTQPRKHPNKYVNLLFLNWILVPVRECEQHHAAVCGQNDSLRLQNEHNK